MAPSKVQVRKNEEPIIIPMGRNRLFIEPKTLLFPSGKQCDKFYLKWQYPKSEDDVNVTWVSTTFDPSIWDLPLLRDAFINLCNDRKLSM